MKSLARHHPRAAIAATLSALGYAGKQAAVEVVEGATTKIRGVDARAADGASKDKSAPSYQLDDDQKQELLDAVSAEDLKRLAQLAKKDAEETT
jgi:hypothetical protein